MLYLLQACVICILFRMIALSDLCIVRDSPCILICISRGCHICFSLVVLVVGDLYGVG
jgi:hypothetical protein